MDFGQVWMALGIDLQVLQGAVTHLYREKPEFQVIPGDGFRLELVLPLIEMRPECGPTVPNRMGIHLVGDLYIGNEPPILFEAWVRLEPGTAASTDPEKMGRPVGTLLFHSVENVRPEGARGALTAEFEPDGKIGKVLLGFEFDLFSGLLDSITRIIHPPLNPDDEVTIDPAEFAVDFWLGVTAPLRRPVYKIRDNEPFLEFDFAEMTVPALMATVALAGDSPRMVGDPSIVRAGTGLQLVTTKLAFDAKLDVQEVATVGSEIEGLHVDRFKMEAVDGGITVDGKGHKTGADVTFKGTVVAIYQGGTNGHLFMRPAVDTDVDLDTWVVILSAAGIIFLPILGLVLVDIFVWGPEGEAPGKIEEALQDKFTEPLLDAATQVTEGFGVKDTPAAAFLSDIWIFDGNLGVSVVALLGFVHTDIRSVSYDVAHVVKDPKGAGKNKQRKRPVRSVDMITFGTNQTVAPWQAAQLVRDGLVDLPGHHAVHQPLATGEWYLRSNPNDDPTDNLIQ